MSVLNELEAKVEPDGNKTLSVKLDVGRTLAGTLLGIALIGVAAYLWSNHLEVPGGAVFATGNSVIFAILGIAAGEQIGANGAREKLK